MKQTPASPREALTDELYARYSRGGIWRRRLSRSFHTMTWLALLAGLGGLKRLVDFCIALALILTLSPVIVCLAIWRAAQRKPFFEKTTRAGRWCEPFSQYSGILVLFNVLKGDMSFVGPRAVAPGELTPREREARKRYSARPGIICLWWIRKRANIAYSAESLSDAEYVESQTVRGDFGIALRAIPALLYGEGVAVTEDLVTIIGIPIHNVTMTDALEWIVRRASGALEFGHCVENRGGTDDRFLSSVVLPNRASSATPGQICFVNADCANIAWRDPEYRAVLESGDLVLADGIGMKLAGKLLASQIRQNVNGTDMFPRLCETLSGTGFGIYLLGARPGVAEKVAEWIREHHPGTVVSGYRDGYFSPAEEPAVIQEIARSGASVLLVAFGAPRQDKWLHSHLGETGVKVAMGVGGLFDFYSGRIPRAPLWMREAGFEWLYRFYQEPRRMWRRYFVGNVVFLWHVVRSRKKKGGKAL